MTGGTYDLWVVHRKDMRNMYTLMNIRAPPVEGKSTDEPSHAIKLHVTENCNAHMGL